MTLVGQASKSQAPPSTAASPTFGYGDAASDPVNGDEPILVRANTGFQTVSYHSMIAVFHSSQTKCSLNTNESNRHRPASCLNTFHSGSSFTTCWISWWLVAFANCSTSTTAAASSDVYSTNSRILPVVMMHANNDSLFRVNRRPTSSSTS
jgi:hypothetical protein